MAGNSKTCSHVGVLLWKIEHHGIKLGLTGKSCTDEHKQWNKGATRNLEPGVLKGALSRFGSNSAMIQECIL